MATAAKKPENTYKTTFSRAIYENNGASCFRERRSSSFLPLLTFLQARIKNVILFRPVFFQGVHANAASSKVHVF